MTWCTECSAQPPCTSKHVTWCTNSNPSIDTTWDWKQIMPAQQIHFWFTSSKSVTKQWALFCPRNCTQEVTLLSQHYNVDCSIIEVRFQSWVVYRKALPACTVLGQHSSHYEGSSLLKGLPEMIGEVTVSFKTRCTCTCFKNFLAFINSLVPYVIDFTFCWRLQYSCRFWYSM
jgi:hypothetical protein